MMLEEITLALRSADPPSADALRAGVAKSDQLAPIIFGLVDKLCDGVFLLPEENALLRCGLAVLGASKHPGLYTYVLKLTYLEQEELEPVFPLHISVSLTRLLLSVWDKEVDALFAAIENDELISEVRSAWFDVLARGVFDGVIARKRALEFLARLEREGTFEDGDSVWWSWEEAVIRLGAVELEPALRRVWAKVVFDEHTPEELDESLAALHRAASNLADPALFDEDESAPSPIPPRRWLGSASARRRWKLGGRKTISPMTIPLDPSAWQTMRSTGFRASSQAGRRRTPPCRSRRSTDF